MKILNHCVLANLFRLLLQFLDEQIHLSQQAIEISVEIVNNDSTLDPNILKSFTTSMTVFSSVVIIYSDLLQILNSRLVKLPPGPYSDSTVSSLLQTATYITDTFFSNQEKLIQALFTILPKSTAEDLSPNVEKLVNLNNGEKEIYLGFINAMEESFSQLSISWDTQFLNILPFDDTPLFTTRQKIGQLSLYYKNIKLDLIYFYETFKSLQLLSLSTGQIIRYQDLTNILLLEKKILKNLESLQVLFNQIWTELNKEATLF